MKFARSNNWNFPSTILQVAMWSCSTKNPVAGLNSMKEQVLQAKSAKFRSWQTKRQRRQARLTVPCLCADPVLALQRSLVSKTMCSSMPEAFCVVQLPFFPRPYRWSLINSTWVKPCIMIFLIELNIWCCSEMPFVAAHSVALLGLMRSTNAKIVGSACFLLLLETVQ